MTKKLFFFLFLLPAFILTTFGQQKSSTRILFIPLDDRPPTFQWVVKMGEVGDAEVVAPPREILGRFTKFGEPDAIIAWVKKQNLKSFDAAIVAVDMLAYGGLVAMREFETDEKTALKRLDFIREIKKNAPQMKIYASSVIMRLAPTGNVVNESYRENLAKWAEVSVDPNEKNLTAELEKKIPAAALSNYKNARARDLKINLAAVRLVQDKILEQLILGQDDAKPKGVHVADRERLIAEVKNLNLQSKIGIQPGADELSLLQLARSLSDKYAYRPKIKAVYSSEKIRNQIMPYEDRPLHQTVSFQIQSVGATEVQTENEADIIFYVYASRFEAGRAESFAEEINKTVEKEQAGTTGRKPYERQIIVADVDPKGDVQGADPKFAEALKAKGIFNNLAGYAAWNTAGNTVGTALPHGFVFSAAVKTFDLPLAKWKMSVEEHRRRQAIVKKIDYAQTWFMLNRVLDDYVYHSIVRPQAIQYGRDNKWNVFKFDEEQNRNVENFIAPKLKRTVVENLNAISPLHNLSMSNLLCENTEDFKFWLPWGRTFEGEFEYKLNCRQLESQTIKTSVRKKK